MPAKEPNSAPLDVWLRFDSPDDEEPSHEANTFRDGDGFRVDWYHTGVGLVTSVPCATYDQARTVLESSGYQDFSS